MISAPTPMTCLSRTIGECGSNFSLNLGLRYEYNGPYTEAHNRIAKSGREPGVHVCDGSAARTKRAGRWRLSCFTGAAGPQ